MNGGRFFLGCGLVSTLIFGVVAVAEEGARGRTQATTLKSRATGVAKTRIPATAAAAKKSAPAPAPEPPSATISRFRPVLEEAPIQAEVPALRVRLAARAASIPAAERRKAEERLREHAKDIDEHAAAGGETKITGRLAQEFAVSPDDIAWQKASLSVTWGELTIAHTLEANATGEVTVDELIALRREGMGWGTIAAGLGLELGSVIRGMRAESQVARGIEKADGQVATMRMEPQKSASRPNVVRAARASARTGVAAATVNTEGTGKRLR